MENQPRCDCGIDPDALDVEWLDQPNLFLCYSELMVDARLEMDRSKELMEVIKAEVDTETRKSHAKENKRLTETQVANLVIQDPKYREAVDNYLSAKHNFEIISARVRALDQRKTALENLVMLHRQQYFAGPSVTRDLSREYAARQQQTMDRETAQNRIRDRINNRVSTS